MKKLLFVLSLVAISAAPALAFHDGGVAHCNGCHTMHNSQDGALVDPDSPGGIRGKISKPAKPLLEKVKGSLMYHPIAEEIDAFLWSN